MRTKLLSAAALILITTSGCATNTPVTDGGCLVFDPLSYSRSDTAATIEGILDHNAKWERFCE